VLGEVTIKGMAHITGGGLTENVPRVLPVQTTAVFRKTAWPRQPVFGWIQEAGAIAEAEMLRTFNCGLGMVLIVGAGDAERALKLLAAQGERGWIVGQVRARRDGETQVIYED
jgi:phosphoribosylformylglycinamidine cyclo-ligase